jgi:hypothetical protein
VAGFFALPGNAVGAESDTDAYCGLAGEFHDHIRSTFDLQPTATDGDTTPAQPGDTVELADATEREYALAMVDVAPLEARAALVMLAEDGIAGTSDVVLEAIEASVEAECGLAMFEIELPDGHLVDVVSGELDSRLWRAVGQMKPAIEAVLEQLGDDTSICIVSAEVGANVLGTVWDGSSAHIFRFDDGELTIIGDERVLEGCASADDALTFDTDVFFDFLADHDVDRIAITSLTGDSFGGDETITYTGDPVYAAWAFPIGSGASVYYELDPQTGETVSTVTSE